MTQVKTHATRRDDLILESANQIADIERGIEQKRTDHMNHKGKAAGISQGLYPGDAAQEMQSAGRLEAEIRADEHTLKELTLEHARIASGNHPELASLALTEFMGRNERNNSELANARADFIALMTTELKDAAQRYVTASREADPLAPVPNLADIIANAAVVPAESVAEAMA